MVLPVPGDTPRQPDGDRDAWRKAEVALRRLDVGIGGRHIAGLHRHHLLGRAAAERLFEHADKIEQCLGAVVAEIVEAMLAGPRPPRLGRPDDWPPEAV